MSHVIALIVRVAVTAALAWLALEAMLRTEGEEVVGANIGAGLAAFLVVAVVSLVWSFLDARGGRSWLATVVLWGLVGLVLGLLASLRVHLTGGLSVDVMSDDLPGSLVFGLVLAGVPAALGAAVGAALRSSGGRRARH